MADLSGAIGAPKKTWAVWSGLIAFVGVSLWLAAAPAVAGSRIVLATVGGSPDWLLGVFRFAGADSLAGGNAGWTFYLPLMAAMVLYAVIVWRAEDFSLRVIWGVVIGLHAVFFLAPPLLSQDVFSYIAYARLGVVHDLNPYAYSPLDIPNDPVFGFAGSKSAVNVYGPLFTLVTYPLASTGVATAFWTLKAVAVASSLGLLVIVQSIAKQLATSQVRAVVILGLCPATLVHVVGGAHNEALVMLLVFAGIATALGVFGAARSGLGGFVSALAIGIKASAAAPLPFMLAATRERSRMLIGMIGAFMLTLATAWIAFGSDSMGAVDLISSNQDLSSRWSIPHKTVDGIELLFGSVDRAVATDVVRAVLVALLAVLVLYLLWRSYRRPDTWIENAGWATLGVLIASAWLVPWYLLWLLPFAALARSRALVCATVVFCGYTMAIAIPF